MSEFGTVIAVTQTLFAALDSSILKQVLPAFSYKFDLRGLKETVKTIESVLLDAGNKSALTSTESDYIQRLKDAVYDADDLFDKFFTMVDHPQSRHRQGNSNSLANKVHGFFSFRNPFIVAYSMSREIKKIRNKLNAFADDHARFGFSVDPRPRARLEETHSYVHADNVVGREGDTTNVIRMLLDSDEDIGFLSIVGVPGVGKTSLAKVVLGDERIKAKFPLKLWVSLSQEGGTPSDSRHVLLKILESVGCRLPGRVAMEYVQSVYQRQFRGKKFLLVLDDVWTEKLLEWQDIKSFLMIGGSGSKVIVTTRSRETANIVGNDTYELEGLSKANSWRLFEMTSFRKPFKDPELVKIGEKIVEKCSNVPLAIKVVGSLLNGKPIDKWLAFEANGLDGTFNIMNNEIMSVLKFSYDNLEPSLKNCFAYCAVFPKSYVINKEMLMNLWEAQGYIVPFYRGQSIESACEEHFCVLLQRCFFSDVKKNDFGDVESFKIHDLMHDLTQNVSGTEIHVMKLSVPHTGYRPRHIFDVRDQINERDFVDSKLRSYLMFESHSVCGSESVCVDNLVKNSTSVRALAFNYLSVDTLPRAMSRLLHLRYLNLAESKIRSLPDSIVNLHNLRTLNLRNCYKLSRWPKKFTKLASLTHLYIDGCECLSSMPYGKHKMRNLHVLDMFLVKDERDSFRDLKALAMNLKGQICIQFKHVNFKNVERYKWDLNCLEGAKDLKKVDILFGGPLCSDRENDDENRVGVEAVMEKLQPHCNLQEFNLWDYHGYKIGSWGRAQDNWATRLPNLVCIRLSYCSYLQQLPSLSQMRHLRSLQLKALDNLEYVEEDLSRITSNSNATFFPSLESLEIRACGKLQGWWRSGHNSDLHSRPTFPCLSQVTISGCTDFRSFPHCLSLQTLSLQENNPALRITAGGVHSPTSSCDDIKLGLIAELDRVEYLTSLAPKLLTGLYISNNVEMESLWEVEDVFKNCSSSLLTFEIQNYSKLKSLRGGLEHLTALHSLTLEGCKELKLEEAEGMPWKPLCHNLRRLRLDRLNNIETLPDGMQHLTSLEHLQIKECEKLRALPQWVRCLQSLQSLHIESCRSLVSLPGEMKTLKSLQVLKIYRCPELREACNQQRGKEWHNISHIPDIDID